MRPKSAATRASTHRPDDAPLIDEGGPGRLAPLETGAAGLIEIIGQPSVSTPTTIPTPEDAARAHVALYRKWGLLP